MVGRWEPWLQIDYMEAYIISKTLEINFITWVAQYIMNEEMVVRERNIKLQKP